ncbi:MAG TPA: sigma 54-interacting transcriptional regulator [Minicystis sp.]|nr:sigma 54-interacting transcriptional regulator [Minicystis sp.]
MASGGPGAAETIDVHGGGAHTLVDGVAVVVTQGPDAGTRAASQSDRLVVGAAESADLVLHDPTVSRFHCELSPRAGRVFVRDLGSRNGTVVDGLDVVEAYAVEGAKIAVGRSELRLELRGERVRLALSERESFGLMVGTSKAMRRVFAVLERAATSDATVLLEGETGTGKEVAAESIHRESARKGEPFVVVDCGAIPEDLLESELFGHEKGAFTGATGAREGAFRAAHGGTIFLDEIGELGLELQPKLLRALERREVKPVGGDGYRPIDVRVVAATNRNLAAEVNERRFRSDLYYRVAVVQVRLPPLRDRREDIPALAGHLLAQMGASRSDLVDDRFLAELRRHAWPGNVRELRNYLERCLAMREQLPVEPDAAAASAFGDAGDGPDLSLPLKLARERWSREFERRYVTRMLERHAGNVSAAAREAGVDRMHFYRLLWRFGLK